MKYDDDPVEELHRIRRVICKEAGGSPEAYARYYMEMSKKRIAMEKAAKKRRKAQIVRT